MSDARQLVIFDDNASLYADALQQALTTSWKVEVGPNSIEWLEKRIGQADAAIGLKLPQELLPSARRLKLLLFPGAGVIHQDPQELPEGCLQANVYEHEIPVAEYVFLALLMLGTGIAETAAAFRTGDWMGNGRTGGTPHNELCGQTLGLIGYGHIGKAVARRAESFGIKVQAVRQYPSRDESDLSLVRLLGGVERLPDLLANSDFVVIACPLTAETRNLLSSKELRLMKRSAVLVNVSRAEIVNEEALFKALRDRWFAAAALDVWYQYPASGERRLHGSEYPFHELPNVFATPHSSAWTGPMIERRARRMAENLDRFARGEKLERVVLTGTWRGI